jgi:chemotaxis protein MotA
MSYLLGFIISIFAVVISTIHLKQSFFSYYDFVAVAVVLGGTFSIFLMTFPWTYSKELKESFFKIFKLSKSSAKEVVLDGIDFISGKIDFSTLKSDKLSDQVFKDGQELISLGFSKEKIEEILSDRVRETYYRFQTVGNAFKSLAKYPPAFGLLGTVLGLVSLMRAISQGANGEEVGIRMAVALVATMYGLFISNLVLNPTGETIIKNAQAEVKNAEIAIHSVILKCTGANLLEAQEVLNSYLLVNQRVNVISQNYEESSGEIAA